MNQVWKSDNLKEMVCEAHKKICGNIRPHYHEGQDQMSTMVEILAPAGYHQYQEIAETLGLDFDENLANEWDWDSFREHIHHLNSRLAEDQKKPLGLPGGLILSLGYDKEGNFGLVLKKERENNEKNPGGSFDINASAKGSC